MSVERITGDNIELVTVDYSDETGPLYYVWVNGTPMLPEMPLPWDEAEGQAEAERDDNPDASVEVVECTEEDLKWAGVRPRGGAS